MYFDDVSQIPQIAGRSGCSIFVVPEDTEVRLPKALVLEPREKSVITIDEVREMTRHLAAKQITEQYVVVRPADKMGLDSANAFLKNLEEPGDRVHFVLITEALTKILPTILSRAAIYVLRRPSMVDAELVADAKVKDLAKRLIAAKPTDLVKIAEEITKKKDGVRSFALMVLGVAIEMLYKSYFMTKKEVFVKKLPKFLAARDAIEQNGHVKLHLVSDLL